VIRIKIVLFDAQKCLAF